MLQSLEKYLYNLFNRFKATEKHLQNSLLIQNLSKINYFYITNPQDAIMTRGELIYLTDKLKNNTIVNEINIPFENVWIEFKNGIQLDQDPLPLKGIGIFETQKGYQIYAISYKEGVMEAEFNFELLDDRIRQIFNTFNYQPDENGLDYGFMSVILSYLNAIIKNLNLINNRTINYITNTEKVNVRTRVNGKFTKYKYNPEHIIYIAEHKEVKKDENLVKRVIKKPDFAYEVMGHWRRLNNPNTLGKNRQGEYCVEGRTWVKNFIKGSGELKKRVRVCVG